MAPPSQPSQWGERGGGAVVRLQRGLRSVCHPPRPPPVARAPTGQRSPSTRPTKRWRPPSLTRPPSCSSRPARATRRRTAGQRPTRPVAQTTASIDPPRGRMRRATPRPWWPLWPRVAAHFRQPTALPHPPPQLRA
eukprot:7390305-Prymnesium_polylepis.1